MRTEVAMTRGHLTTITLIGLSLCISPNAFAPAPDAAAPVPDVKNSNYQWKAVVNANGVLIRSGAGDNYYPTQRLDKGTNVIVVGNKFDWLKIIPPEGSFSYVAKTYVEKTGDGSIGRVTRPDLNVRAGSSLNQIKTAIQTKLNEGDKVEIIGEADEYFKIKPPAGAYLYVDKRFVDPVENLGPQIPPTPKPSVADTGARTGETPGNFGGPTTGTAEGANPPAPGNEN